MADGNNNGICVNGLAVAATSGYDYLLGTSQTVTPAATAPTINAGPVTNCLAYSNPTATTGGTVSTGYCVQCVGGYYPTVAFPAGPWVTQYAVTVCASTTAGNVANCAAYSVAFAAAAG